MSSAGSSSTSSTTDGPRVEAGRVGRPHGLDGSFYVTRPVLALLDGGAPLTVGGRPRAVERRAGTAARPIVRLAGCARREAAEALRGEPLWVEAPDLPALGSGEYWGHELVGCVVAGAGGEVLGRVERLVALPSCEALEVAGRLVPLVGDAVRSVDLAARRIEVDLAFLGPG